MRYVSTRGESPPLGFGEVLLSGLAPDGGLYVPQRWPRLEAEEIAALADLPYCEAAKRVAFPFVEGFAGEDEFASMLESAYASFRHPAIAPLVQLDSNLWVLELFHGPTLSFKDLAMQLLARLMDRALAASGRRARILAATSGDTGGAAASAFAGAENVDLFVLFPEGRVSSVQRMQMTATEASNVHAIAVQGDFDDCQALAKALFADRDFSRRMSLSSVNSINWARIMAQTAYYFTSSANLGAPHRRLSFVIPTGNFGDAFSGFCARRMGLPVESLCAATNSNDVLTRAVETGRYEPSRVHATHSPAMDIQAASNFERLLFEACGRDGSRVRELMASLSRDGGFALPDEVHDFARGEYRASRCGEEETLATISGTFERSGYLCDPHTAVGLKAACEGGKDGDGDCARIVLSTAHPSKFPDSVALACGVRPSLPGWVGDLMDRRERSVALPVDSSALRRLIVERVGDGGGGR